MDEIQSLTQRVSELGQAVDFWNVIMLWGLALAAVAAIIIGISTRLIVLRAGQQAESQGLLSEAKDRKVVADSKDKDHKIADALKTAGESNERAGRAQASLALAEQHASEANYKAEGFRLDIAKANLASSEAQARVAGAMAEAARANLELERIKTPRALINIATLTESLKAYRGTEYTFTAVFGDEESILLLRQLDRILLDSGWTRTKPPGGFPGVNVYGKEQDFTVPTSLRTGIQISVDSDVPLATLQSLPTTNLPPAVGGAVGLAVALTNDVRPSQEAGCKANVENGISVIVRIEVGRKP